MSHDERVVTYSQIPIVQQSSRYGQNQVRISLVEVREPEHACAAQIFVLVRYLSYAQNHNDEYWNLNDVTNVELEQACFRLLLVIVDGSTEVPGAPRQRHLAVLE